MREKTFKDYTAMLKRYVLPLLGQRPLGKVTAADVQAVYDAMRDRGLSPRTIRYTHAVLRSALEQAKDWGLIPRNPAAAVRKNLPRQKKKEMQALTPQEAQRFLAAARSDRYHVAFLLSITTGLRPSEYLGLKWEDIDLTRGMVSVQRTLARNGRCDKDGAPVLEATKRTGSRRTVKLQRHVVQALQQHRDRQAFERNKAKDRWQDYGLVFATTVGAPVKKRGLIRHHFKVILRLADLPDIRLYDLRHSAATLALLAGAAPKVVSEMLGHASVAFTLDTYAHVLPNMQDDAAARMEALLLGGADDHPLKQEKRQGRRTRTRRPGAPHHHPPESSGTL